VKDLLRKWKALVFLGRPPAQSDQARLVSQPAITAAASPGYSADRPIDSEAEDKFKRWPFAKRIGDTLASRVDPSSLVIGLYGPWGDGKTSTLRMMANVLRDNPKVVVVNFNPWLFASDEQLLRSFFATLATAIGKSLPTKTEDLGRILKRYGSLLSLASVSIAGVVSVGVGDAASGLGEALSTVELDELRQRLETLLREADKRVIVLIDDIDRLDRHEIQAIFKLVKLSASFDFTSYVLAFDDEIVAAALGEKYGGGGSTAGRAFLEKIIQVPLHLPPADPQALRQLAFAGVDLAILSAGMVLSEQQAQSFGRRFVDGLEPSLKTPRQAKLFVNALLFALPLLKGEVDPVDQMLIEGIRILYPRLYFAIRDNSSIFLKGQHTADANDREHSKAKEFVNQVLADAGIVDAEQVRSRLLETMFPRLQSIFGNMLWNTDWDETWAREQRICSAFYFPRYFAYGVPHGDLPDAAVTALVEAAAAGSIEVEALLVKTAGGGSMAQLIKKLRFKEDDIAIEAVPSLTTEIARHGELLPREQGVFMTDLTMTQAAILIAHLVRRIASEQGRDALARTIAETAEQVPFAVECVSWFIWRGRDQETPRMISADCQRDLGTILADRIRASAMTTPPYSQFGRDAPRLFWTWKSHGEEGEVRRYLEARLATMPAQVDDFLRPYVPISWSLSSGLSSVGDFHREAYDGIAQLIDPEFIMSRLRERYGREVDQAEYRASSELPIAMRIAHQFAYIHMAVQKERNTVGDARPA
jgi:hypothetical protein